MRVHSNIADMPSRRLKKQFNAAAKAVGTAAPTTLSQAMGQAGKNGVLSFIFSDGGTGNVTTIWIWSKALADIASGNGWAPLGNNAAQSQQGIDQLCAATILIPEDAIFFLQATTAVTDCIVSGTAAGINLNTDLTNAANTTT